jgi:LysM repeat protein
MVVVPLTVPSPMPSPDGMRTSVPAAPVAKAPQGDPVIVVVDPSAKPDSNGKVRATVYRPRRTPQTVAPKDRTYRLKRGETLATVAKRFGVTEKSIRLANAITRPSTLRTGEVVRIPGSFDVMVNNQRVAFDVNPRVEGGIPLAPFRQIFEHAGGSVVYFPDSREVTATSEQKEIKLKIGSKEALVNQVIVVMQREAFIDGGRTIVPISFMEKALDLQAEYDTKSGTISLVKR